MAKTRLWEVAWDGHAYGVAHVPARTADEAISLFRSQCFRASDHFDEKTLAEMRTKFGDDLDKYVLEIGTEGEDELLVQCDLSMCGSVVPDNVTAELLEDEIEEEDEE